MSLKRILCLLLMIVMVLTMVTACGGAKQNPADQKQETSQAATQPDTVTEPEDNTGLPIVKEPLTLTYWVAMNPNAAAVVKDYGEIEAMKVFKEKTGIDIKWMHPPVGQETDQFNLMVSTNDLPDMIEYNWASYPGGPEKAMQEGVLIKLNDLIDQYAPNLGNIYRKYPEIRKQVTTDNGTMYNFPYLYVDEGLEGPFKGFQIRQDWLDKLGLAMPKTMDDWYSVLTAFRNNDPNGNKEKDELPFESGKAASSTTMNTGLRFFMTAWGMTPDYNGWYRVDNKIKFAFAQPEYLKYLKTMAKWYKEGLIDPDYAITDAKGVDSKMTTNKVGAYFGYPASGLGRYMGLMEKENPNVKLAGAPYPVLKAGDKQLVGHKNSNFSGIGTVITSANKHQAESARWLDFRYSEEGHLLMDYGIEGKSYVMKDGVPTYTEAVLKDPGGMSFTQAIAKYSMASWGTPRVHDVNSEKQMQARKEQVEALDTWFLEAKDRNLPPLTQTAEESQKFANIMNEVLTFVSETEDKLIMGATSIDSFNFDEYLKTLEKMGINDAIAIEQAALDRFNAR